MHTDELRFRETIEPYKTKVAEAGCVIVGYSGGADSSCLLRLMTDWCRENKITVAAAHVNHLIRGSEADRDEEFAREVCRQLGVEFFSLRVNVPELAAKLKKGIEETARQVRYEFFDEISEKLTSDPKRAVIATAHNADDSLETVIFNLLRGSGLRGMCGIDPFRDFRYLRPLINAGSDEIRQWCFSNGVDFVTDSTNSDTDYTRNRIRHSIVPLMKEITPSPAKQAARMSENLRSDRDYIESEAERIAAEKDMTRHRLSSLHPAVASRVLSILLKRSGISDVSLEEKHISEALRLIGEGDVHACMSLPGGVRMTLDRENIRFEPDTGRKKQHSTYESMSEEVLFRYPDDGGKFSQNGCTVEFFLSDGTSDAKKITVEENIYKLSILTILRFDKIKGVLRIRTKKDGDAYRYGGMTHRVKRMFSDRKLSADERKSLPVFEDDCGIVWIPGFPLRDGLRWDGEGQPLTITYSANTMKGLEIEK